MMRRPEWEHVLSDWIAQAGDRAFRYGRWDCCIFAAGAVKAMTGDDPMRAFRGAYKSAATADQALASIGAGSLEATLDGMFDRVPVGFARAGDLAFYDGSVGVVSMTGDGLFVSAAGLTSVGRAQWTTAWGVGHG